MKKSKSVTIIKTRNGYSWAGKGTPSCTCIYSKKLGENVSVDQLRVLIKNDFGQDYESSTLYNSIGNIDAQRGKDIDIDNIKIVAKKLGMKLVIKR